MWAIMTNAMNYLVALVFRLSPIKFVVLVLIFVIFEVLLSIVWSLLPSWFNMNGLFNTIPSGVWYFLDMIGFDVGVPILIGAWTTRFLIRRIPFVG